MVEIRAQKVANIANELPKTKIFGEQSGDVLILSWGSSHGACRAAAESLLSENLKSSINLVGIDYDARAMEKPSDHCPVWLELNE